MRIRSSFFSFFIFTALPIFSQIQGTVTDSGLKPIEFVNIAVYALPDTTQLKYGTITDSTGFYQISEEILSGNYQIRASFLGYKTIIANIQITDQIAELIQNFVLQPEQTILQELVVQGERPALKAEKGKLIYHLPILLKGKPITNAYDALKEIPGVVEQNERLTLIGANGLTVLLNGKKTSMTHEQLMTLLKSFPLSRVEDVEIMYNTPPQYNIRGAAINVMLKQQADENEQNIWQGEVYGEYMQRTYASGNGRVSLLYLGKNITFDALYSDRYTAMQSREYKTNDHTVNSILYHIKENNTGLNKSNTHNVRTALGVTLNNKDRIEVAYTGIFDNMKPYRISETDIAGKNIQSDTRIAGLSALHNLKADYTTRFGLSAGIDHTSYNNKSIQYLTNTTLSEIRSMEQYKSESNQLIHKTFLYANQNHHLPKNWSVSYGANYSYAATQNRNEALRNEEAYTPSTFQNRQDENIWNLFVGFSKSFSPQFSMQASLTAEFYKTVEESNGKRQILWNDIAYFPAFGATYIPSMTHIFQFSLSSDKEYPPYWILNPTIYYLNVYSEVHGNPQLKPARSYGANLNYIFKRKYVLSAYLNYMPNTYKQMIYQRPDILKSVAKYHNLNYERMMGIAAIVPFEIGKKWQSKITVNGLRMTQKCDNFYDIPFDRSIWLSQLKWDNDFVLSAKPSVKLNISSIYTTPSIQGILDLSDSYNISGAITWSFNHDRAKLIFKATDIFQSSIPYVKIDYKGQEGTLKAFQDTRVVSLSFVYRFGGYKEKERKEVDTSRFGGL